MVKMSVPGKQFLENYSDVLRHHVICILDSGMVLDEDMNLLQTFWDPSLMEISLGSRHRFLLTSTTFAATGLLAAAKCRSVYPLAICLIPTTVRVLTRVVTCCRGQRYKKNFEKLLLLLRTMYDLVKKITQYYSKRDIAVQNRTLQLEAFNILFKPGKEFLKHGIMVVIGVVEVLKMSMLQICELVPIPEGQFLCSTELNLDSFKMFESFAEMKTQFEKLIDLYLLIMSNFLGCLGLSMCVQLWKQPCSFQDILDKLIPDLNTFLQKSVTDVKGKFNLIRYNLCEGAEFKKTINARAPDHFQKPLAELLVNVQLMFENCKRLQYLLEDEHHNRNYTQFDTILKAITNQMESSKDHLSILSKWTEVLNKKAKCVFTEKSPPPSLDTVSILSEEADVDIESKETVELKDEEYNLSIHDSQDDYDDSMSEVDYFDQFVPNENIDIVLLELKKKLEEFQKKTEPLHEENKKLPQLLSPPVVTHSREVNSLLRTVMLTAQTMNRSEEVFGSGTSSSNDSVEL